MRRLAGQFTVAAVLVVPAFLGIAVATAGATTAQAGTVAMVVGASNPHVNLVGSGSSVTFSPSKLVLHRTDCWTMTNKTSKTQTIVSQGSKSSLPPSAEVGVCATPGKYVFTLVSSPNAKLTVKVYKN